MRTENTQCRIWTMSPVAKIPEQAAIACGVKFAKQTKTAAYKVMSDTLSSVAPKSVQRSNLRAIKPSSMSETAAAMKRGKNQVGDESVFVKDKTIIAIAAKSRTLVIRLGKFFISQAYKPIEGSVRQINTFRIVENVRTARQT